MIALRVLLMALALYGCAPREQQGPRQLPAERPPVQTGARPADGSSTAALALEREVYERVNRYRRARGLAPLVLDRRISLQARQHSLAMAGGATSLGHAGFDERVRALHHLIPCRRTAENVAYDRGHRDPASEAVRGWVGSRAHRENIEGQYELTGVGVARNAEGEVYFTEIFVGR